MKRILWVSRHSMTTEQERDLHRIYGKDCQIQQFDRTITHPEEVLEAAGAAEVLAVVLPLNVLSALWKMTDGKEIIQAVSARRPTGQTITNPATGEQEKEYAFVHLGWQRVIRCDYQTEWL